MRFLTFGVGVLVCSLSVFSQNVGVGTTTPQAYLHVKAPNNTQKLLIVEGQSSASEYLIFYQGGFLGIGTSSPSERLHVSGNILFTGSLMPNGNPGSAGQILVSQGPNNPPVWIDTTGMGGDNWGSQVVQVQAPLIGDGTTGNPLGLVAGTNTGDVLVWNGTQWTPGTAPGDNWGTQVVQVQAPLAGDGTAGNPLSIINGSSAGEVLMWNGSSWTLSLPDTLYWNTSGNTGTTTAFIGTINNFPFKIFTNNVERMRITETGLVGIGTTNPSSFLSIGGSGYPSWTVTIQSPPPSTSSQVGGVLRIEASGNYGTSHSYAINGEINNNFYGTKQYGVRGRVVAPNPINIGRSYGVYGEGGNANWNFGVYGTVSGSDIESAAVFGWDAINYPYPTYDPEASMASSGQAWAGYFYGDLYVAYNAVKPGGGSWTAPSDRKLKKNITTFTDGLDVITKINPVRFQYNGLLGLDSTKVYIGVIAQEVAKVAPYATQSKKIKIGDKYEEILYFDPGVLTYVMINAIKEQQQTIESLKDQNKKLMSQIEQLIKQNVILEQKINDLTSK